MNKSEFWYDLPPELIAQTPIEKREQSRLLHLDRSTGDMRHSRFFNLPEFLRRGDCLVMNDSRVLPARLLGEKSSGGAVKIVLLRDIGNEVWECLARPGKRIKTGARLSFGGDKLTAIVTGEADDGVKLIKFNYEGFFPEVLERLGKMPLPPYIHEELEDNERYQTVYSRVIGSAAAPTAGLHFTKELMEQLEATGVELCYMTLHVGLGTFRPVKTDVIEEHHMHSEYFVIPDDTAQIVNRVKQNGGRVIAVGTTSCRALEACAKFGIQNSEFEIDKIKDSPGAMRADDSVPRAKLCIKPFSGFTDIFIYPGYEFRCKDGLITNFHLPESTLVMLVSAFAGRDNIMRAYEEAIRERYRFFSFGDAMLIL